MREFRSQAIGAVFVILTVGAVLCALINFQQQSKYRLPDDGIVWTERTQGGATRVEALMVTATGPGAKAGIRAGDTLTAINNVPVRQAVDVPRVLVGIGAWESAEYRLRRQEVEVNAKLIVGEREPESSTYYQYLVGVAYLSIGLFVWFRRANAPKAAHFFLLCLASFVLSTFHYTGKLNTFDKFIYWGNVSAGLFAPAMFLHFCLAFPEPPRWLASRMSRAAIYLAPLAFLGWVVAISTGAIRTSMPLTEVRWLLDRLWLALLSVSYLSGAAILAWRHHRSSDSLTRQQLKWLRNGAVLGVLPFTLFYVVPYIVGGAPTEVMRLAVLSLGFIPLTWAYAIIRYRLIDVDVIFQQGYGYTLATLAVLGVIYGLIFAQGNVEELSPTAVIVLVVIATFVFQPIRYYLQQILDRHVFYRDSYDYRLTLVEFARELSSETDLDKMLNSVADRLLQTLSVRNVGFFLEQEVSGWRLHLAKGPKPFEAIVESSDLDFLRPEEDRPHLFFENPRRMGGAIAALDYTYYLPCQLRGRVIAWIGVSRHNDGDFLSSDDLELLTTLSGYVGIAIENARLYRSLERKASEYQRLKDFSENIIESINVGILAAGLDDRVESWNSRMEDLTGIAREYAIGHSLSALLPREIAERLAAIRGESNICHVDKVRLRTWVPVDRNGQPNGSARRETVVNIAVAPLVAKDAEQIGRLIIFDDITDRSELERRLVQADKLSSIGLLAAGVAHEVNTPLAVISTYAQMLAKQVDGDDQKSRLLEKIAKQTFRASEIVNSLLNFSRTSQIDLAAIEIPRVVREVLSLVEHQLEKARITVNLDMPESGAVVRGNGGRLQQVFLNLLINARDAMEAVGGTLTIRVRNTAGNVTVEVIDTGRGIPADVLPRIFDPFFTTKGVKKGTGLGLSITYGIVQEHGGTIEAESHPGQGTRFLLTFPASQPHADRPREPQHAAVNA